MLEWVKTTLKRGKSNWLKEYQLISDIWSGKFPKRYKRISLSILEKAFMTVLIFIRSLSLLHISDFLVTTRYSLKSQNSMYSLGLLCCFGFFGIPCRQLPFCLWSLYIG